MKMDLSQWLSTLFFALAIIHVFFSDSLQRKAKINRGGKHTAFAFLGNTTLIFGIWLIPLLLCLFFLEGPNQLEKTFQEVNYREPFSYFVLITVATAQPMIQLFHFIMDRICRLFGKLLSFRWALALITCSLIGGIFSPIAIMALLSRYLSTTFFHFKPNQKLTYYTFATLLVTSAASATIFPINFNFFSPLTSINFNYKELFHLFGWKSLIAVITIVVLGLFIFRQEFARMQKQFQKFEKKQIKLQGRHFLYFFLLLAASFGSQNIYLLLMVIAIMVVVDKSFYQGSGKEGKLSLYLPLTIAFFTTTLEIFARLQTWWVVPLFSDLDQVKTFWWSYLLTGLNENVPLEASKLTQNINILAIVSAGGLTLIAKSSNIVAKKLLKNHFPFGVISPLYHLIYAVPLTLIFSFIVYLLGEFL